MTAGAYLTGVVLLALTVVPVAIAAARLRVMLLPAWRGAAARLAEIVLGIAVVVLLAEALGTAGWLGRAGLAAGALVIAAATEAAIRRAAPVLAAAHPSGAPATDRLVLAGAGVAAGLVVMAWLAQTLGALSGGVPEYDSVWYHLPIAARFAQSGSITGILNVGNAPTSFYPANSELLHAVGMVLFGRDLLSPLLNLGWLGVALLAGWCTGRPWGVASVTMAAVALAAAVDVMVGTQPGSAKNDAMAIALLLAAVALVAHAQASADESAGAILVAALAAGLAVGTRLNLWASVIPLAIVAVVLAPPSRRRPTAGWWVVGVVAGGGLWYGRNLLATGNPLPWFSLRLGGLLTLHGTAAPVDCGRTSLAHDLLHPGFAGAHIAPQLTTALGSAWWLVAAVAIAGIGSALAVGSPLVRGVAAVALAGLVGYAITPATAGGHAASCFAFNTRFAIPSLAVALVLVPILLSRRRRGPLVAVGVLLLAVAVDGEVSTSVKAGAVTAAAGLGVVAVAVARSRGWSGRRVHAAAVVAIVAVVAVGWRQARIYFGGRYRAPALFEPVEPVADALARAGAHGARIAVAGFQEIYPLLGPDLSNQVDLPADRVDQTRFVAADRSCVSWQTALRHGRYRYVVTAAQSAAQPSAAAWTRDVPGAESLLRSPTGFRRRGSVWSYELFRIQPGVRHWHVACTR